MDTDLIKELASTTKLWIAPNVKAKKNYICRICGEQIDAGSTYFNIAKRSNKSFRYFSIKICNKCKKLVIEEITKEKP